MNTSLFRYIWLVTGPPTWMHLVAAAIVGFGSYLVWLGGPQQIDQVLGITLFLQLFVASSGYRARLRAGHLDPVLVGRPGPFRLAAVHWLASIGLGVAVWMALGLVALASRPVVTPTALTPAGFALIAYASTVSWAIALAAGRFSGGVAWLALLLALAAGQQLSALRVGFLPHPETIAGWLRTLGSTLVMPAFLIMDPHDVDLELVITILLATAAVWVCGSVVICFSDARLERS